MLRRYFANAQYDIFTCHCKCPTRHSEHSEESKSMMRYFAIAQYNKEWLGISGGKGALTKEWHNIALSLNDFN